MWKVYDTTLTQLTARLERKHLKKQAGSWFSSSFLWFSVRPLSSSPCMGLSVSSAAVLPVICNGENKPNVAAVVEVDIGPPAALIPEPPAQYNRH